METEPPIFPQPKQPLLLEDVEDLWPLWSEETQRKRYTAKRVELNGQLYAAAISLLGCGLSIIEVARQLGMAEKTVRAIKERESVRVSEQRMMMGRRYLALGWKLLTSVEECLPSMSGKDRAVAGGILTENGLRLMGEPSEKIEVKVGVDREQFRAWLDRVAPRRGGEAAAAGDGEVIDLEEVKPALDSESGASEPDTQQIAVSMPQVASLVAPSGPESGSGAEAGPAAAASAERAAAGGAEAGGGGLAAAAGR